MTKCRYCASGRIVPVLDKRIERSHRAGNKFRQLCKGCRRWLPMTSEEHFRNHHSPHVLPADASPDAENVIPLTEYEYDDELADLAAEVEERRNRQHIAPDSSSVEPVAMTDGGTDLDGDDVDQEDEGAATISAASTTATATAESAQSGSLESADAASAAESSTVAPDAPTPQNRFECPATGCEASHVGYPEQCDECSQPYYW